MKSYNKAIKILLLGKSPPILQAQEATALLDCIAPIFFPQLETNVAFLLTILKLGAGESGKTTIIKQMKILHFQGFTER